MAKLWQKSLTLQNWENEGFCYLWWCRTFGLLAKSLALLEGVLTTASGLTCSIMVTIFQQSKSKERLEKSPVDYPAVEASRFGLRSWSCSLPPCSMISCALWCASCQMLLPAISSPRRSLIAVAAPLEFLSCWAKSPRRHSFRHRNALFFFVVVNIRFSVQWGWTPAICAI